MISGHSVVGVQIHKLGSGDFCAEPLRRRGSGKRKRSAAQFGTPAPMRLACLLELGLQTHTHAHISHDPCFFGVLNGSGNALVPLILPFHVRRVGIDRSASRSHCELKLMTPRLQNVVHFADHREEQATVCRTYVPTAGTVVSLTLITESLVPIAASFSQQRSLAWVRRTSRSRLRGKADLCTAMS